MNKKRSTPPTELNKYDRKILEKYTGFYTNMIESNTAKTTLSESQPMKERN